MVSFGFTGIEIKDSVTSNLNDYWVIILDLFTLNLEKERRHYGAVREGRRLSIPQPQGDLFCLQATLTLNIDIKYFIIALGCISLSNKTKYTNTKIK
jgi:hypothetical protein